MSAVAPRSTLVSRSNGSSITRRKLSIGGRVLASHYSVNCLRPAVGHRFIARARVIKPGKSQVFTACELHAEGDNGEKLVATGETLLLVVAEGAAV